MDYTHVIEIVEKLGIAALSIVSIIYVIVKSQKEREKNQQIFMEYVETNNHQKSEMIEKSIEALTKVNYSMEMHNEISKSILSAVLIGKSKP